MNDNKTSAPRVALVTGANRGIGAAIAAHLRDAGYRVAGTLRSGELDDGILPVFCDVSDPDSVDQAFATVESELGPVEVVVANAGITRDKLAMQMSDDDFLDVLNTNLAGAFRVARRALRPMMKARFGRIVLIGSTVATMGNAGQINYTAAKAGLVGMARTLTREMGKRGITCNVVAPGFIDTDMTRALPEDVRNTYATQIPAARFGTVDDVAAAVRFLVSDEAGYISGALLPVDGGIGMGH